MTFFLFIYGACLGSGLVALATRYSRGESGWWPRSHCDNCGQSLPYWQLWPVLSFLMLRGRCFYCRTSLPLTYLGLEFSVGVLVTTITDQKSLLVVMWLLTWTYAALCDHLTLTFPSWVSYLGLGIVLGAQPIALLLVAGTMVVYHWAWAQWRKPGLGDGDIDLMVQYALLFGVETTSRWLILACGLALVAHNRGNAPQAFIPWLAISAGLFWI